jgi:hypothetical protein
MAEHKDNASVVVKMWPGWLGARNSEWLMFTKKTGTFELYKGDAIDDAVIETLCNIAGRVDEFGRNNRTVAEFVADKERAFMLSDHPEELCDANESHALELKANQIVAIWWDKDAGLQLSFDESTGIFTLLHGEAADSDMATIQFSAIGGCVMNGREIPPVAKFVMQEYKLGKHSNEICKTIEKHKIDVKKLSAELVIASNGAETLHHNLAGGEFFIRKNDAPTRFRVCVRGGGWEKRGERIMSVEEAIYAPEWYNQIPVLQAFGKSYNDSVDGDPWYAGALMRYALAWQKLTGAESV